MHREAREHSSRFAVDDKYLLVARAISASLERRDHMAEPIFEPILRTERETPNGGVKPVGADRQVETQLRGMPESNIIAIRVLFESDDFIAENGFDVPLDLLVKQRRKIAAPDGDVTPSAYLSKHPGSKAGQSPAAVVNDAQSTHVIAVPLNFRYQPHALGDVVAESPEIDDVATTKLACRRPPAAPRRQE